MAVLPATQKVDLKLLASAAGAAKSDVATEAEFRERFAECELGAMPPCGNLFAMPVYVEESLAREKNIAFNAGTHSELVQMATADFVGLVKPKLARIATVYSS